MLNPKISIQITSIAVLVLLPLFFVFHGVVENYALIKWSEALLLLLTYFAAGAVLCLVFYLFLKSIQKATLVTGLVLAINFFFGSIHDRLKLIAGNSFFTSYTFLFITVGLLVLAATFILKKTRRPIARPIYYLNVLFLVLIVYDVAVLFVKKRNNNFYGATEFQSKIKPCPSCPTPDVFLIVADEYAGNKELREKFGFDNAKFDTALQQRGFHVVTNPASNYHYTPFSMASALNMAYLNLKDSTNTVGDIPFVLGKIRTNQLTYFFYQLGYAVYNNSIFDLPGAPRSAMSSFLPNKTKLITAQTFLNRVERDLYFHFTKFFQKRALLAKDVRMNLNSNRFLYQKTIAVAALKTKKPTYSYTHLSMPHPPYYFDSSGRAVPEDSAVLFKNVSLYTGYLQYANKKIIALVDSIFATNNTPPIIIFMSDHGFRYGLNKNERQYNFSNYCAVFSPGKKYDSYYTGMSLVNLFRVVLNVEFGQKLPLLRDESIML